MKTLFKPLLAATILSLSMTSMAMAKPDQGYDKQHHCVQKENHARYERGMQFPHRPPFLKGIDLTEAQKDQLFDLTYAEVPTIRAQMKARHQLKKELIQLSKNYSEEKVKTIADQLATIEHDSVLAKAHHHQKVLNILTPAQRKQVTENIEKFKEHHDTRPDRANKSERMHSAYRDASPI